MQEAIEKRWPSYYQKGPCHLGLYCVKKNKKEALRKNIKRNWILRTNCRSRLLGFGNVRLNQEIASYLFVSLQISEGFIFHLFYCYLKQVAMTFTFDSLRGVHNFTSIIIGGVTRFKCQPPLQNTISLGLLQMQSTLKPWSTESYHKDNYLEQNTSNSVT